MVRPITSEYFDGRVEYQDAFANILERYLQPSFGSISKRDIDITIFMAMQDVDLLDKNPSIYEVMQALHITRSKARSLIYESTLRRAETEYNVDEKLKDALCKPVFLSGADKMIGIELDNPLLIDHLKFKLRKLGHITDGSFNQDMVKLTPLALAALYEDYIPENRRTEMKQVLREAGIHVDSNKLIDMLVNLFGKFKDKIEDNGIEVILGALGRVISGVITTPQILAVLGVA